MPEGERDKLGQMAAEKQQLENKLGRSLQKIEKLQEEIEKMNRSVFVGSNDPNNSFSRNNISALDISTSKVVEEKDVLQKKYGKLKEDYLKLKTAYDRVKSTTGQGEISNPEFDK